ncbi:transcriptional regulator, DeoR family [Pseudooceanicola antarcticus]|uniref:DeoR/GlpR transcriptional regulator n=1 Tax=Pseudooceanicola antarcticus TaxID=1247613 RepID=A0A285IPV3_9RHOB|nr:DeoR/GlpR family DNA-binding transcription regulator [Pseudooceanicola antarcticus]PJE31439.1 DeoR/GlpR transcriptional regulator [Pseudooceanicola antarcticus]SNY49984.1 transcriptional regulator, DeoR family [Pseudooceanicola antarcticus]
MDRREQILQQARRDGRVMVEELALAFGVSAHTIRRDINTLCEEAKLRRLHGGAEYIEGHANLPYQARAVLNFDAKSAIARAVAAEIPDEATIFISIGTTPAIVAGALAGKQALTVITNNLNAAFALSENPSNRIILPGGELRLPDRDLLGPEAVELFSTYRADYGIYGVGGIDSDGSLLDFHASEVQMREQMRINSRRSILVADRSKFGRRAAAVGGHMREADMLVLDRAPEAPHAQLLEDCRGKLVLAMEGG